MNWNDVPAGELLDKLKAEHKSDSEKETILNDYLVAKHEYLENEPQKLLPLLEEMHRIKADKIEKDGLTGEDFAICANDIVFLSVWMGRIEFDANKDVERSEDLLKLAKDLLELYDDEYVEELRHDNLKSIEALEEKISKYKKSLYQQDDEDDEENKIFMPKSLEDYLQLLEKKRVYQKLVNEKLGEAHRYGYIFTGNSGTGKRTAAKKLFEALKAIDPDIRTWVEVPAYQVFDSNTGFSPIKDFINENKYSLIYISDAEDLSMKGLMTQNGIEILANKLKTEHDVVVVLSGRHNELVQLVNSSQAAKDYFLHQFQFDDLSPEALTEVAVDYADSLGYSFTEEAREQLFIYLGYEYKMRCGDFTNIHLAHNIIDDQILPALIQRMVDGNTINAGTDEAKTITADDIPQVRHRDPKKAIEKLESLVGLDNIKQSIMAHASLVNLNRKRMALGLFNHMPPMHMVFTGNPGTGKTTVAELIGEIYYGMGVLSSGHLVEVDRSKLVGQFIGDTEKNTLNAINSAAGGVLFIDEAYNLFTNDPDRRDYGHRVIETLLTYLSMEQTNMIVVLAGYTVEMENLLQSNPGLKSRFSYIFHFNDYTPEQLMKIGGFVLKKEQYQITPEAEKKLAQYVIEAYSNKDEHFGNGRFITRLLTTKIIPAVSDRLYKLPADSLTKNDLVTITEADVPEVQGRNKMLSWDNTIIDDALDRLNELAGLQNVKKALNDYVVILKANYENKMPVTGNHMIWSFLGNTGTGKSTVAEILCCIMQGAGLLPTNHFSILNIEEFATANNPTAIIEKAMLKSSDGMLFLDLDSENYKNYNTDFLQYWIENKRKELNMNLAVVIARTNDENDAVVRNLVKHGVVPSNHILVFEDFVLDDLKKIFRYLLKKQYGLDITTEAEKLVDLSIEQLYNSRKNFAVNARTMQLLASTVAQITRLRIFNEKHNTHNKVTKADVERLEWNEDSLPYRRIGF